MFRVPFHLVEVRPWPFTSALRALFLAIGLINWFHFNNLNFTIIAIFLIMLSIYQWWRDIIREATFIGKHTSIVQRGLRIGILLFILSEVCFFFAFFWAFFHRSLAPTPELGCVWPPIGITPIDPLRIPLLNTAVLLASGFTVTWSHHRLISGKKKIALLSILFTIFLGFYFTYLQLIEYIESSFSIADRIYGSTFFVATGFHGAHVIIGSTFLFINLLRILKNHYSKNHHFGFEAAAWYWHFVDVVWICLYISIYYWGR